MYSIVMGIDNFFVNESFVVSLDTKLYADSVNANLAEYDYILNIDIGAANWASMNTLFNARQFIQNSGVQNTAGETGVNVSLSANLSALNTLLYATNAVDIYSMKPSVTNCTVVYGTLDRPAEKLLGLRFLEIVATKIFGHAKARAAIANDTQFYDSYAVSGSIVKQVADGINNVLGNQKSNIFNMYVAYDRVEENANNTNDNADANAPKDFNFENTNWEFPIYFTSAISDNNSAVAGDMTLLNNGPNVGGNQLLGGSMNVPILLRLHRSVA